MISISPRSGFTGHELAALSAVDLNPPHRRMTRLHLAAMADLEPHVVYASCVPAPPFFETEAKAASRLWTTVWNSGLDLIVCLDRGPGAYFPTGLAEEAGVDDDDQGADGRRGPLPAATDPTTLRSQLRRMRSMDRSRGTIEAGSLRVSAGPVALDGSGGGATGAARGVLRALSAESARLGVTAADLQVRLVAVRHAALPREAPPHHCLHVVVRGWPDFGVPSSSAPARAVAAAILESARLGRKRGGPGEEPVGGCLVHCLAGIGRTGSLLLLASAMHAFVGSDREPWVAGPSLVNPFVRDGHVSEEEAAAGAAALPFPRHVRLGSLLLDLRQQRSSSMVENRRQLGWVYDALCEEAAGKGWRPVAAGPADMTPLWLEARGVTRRAKGGGRAGGGGGRGRTPDGAAGTATDGGPDAGARRGMAEAGPDGAAGSAAGGQAPRAARPGAGPAGGRRSDAPEPTGTNPRAAAAASGTPGPGLLGVVGASTGGPVLLAAPPASRRATADGTFDSRRRSTIDGSTMRPPHTSRVAERRD